MSQVPYNSWKLVLILPGPYRFSGTQIPSWAWKTITPAFWGSEQPAPEFSPAPSSLPLACALHKCFDHESFVEAERSQEEEGAKGPRSPVTRLSGRNEVQANIISPRHSAPPFPHGNKVDIR